MAEYECKGCDILTAERDALRAELAEMARIDNARLEELTTFRAIDARALKRANERLKAEVASIGILNKRLTELCETLKVLAATWRKAAKDYPSSIVMEHAILNDCALKVEGLIAKATPIA